MAISTMTHAFLWGVRYLVSILRLLVPSLKGPLCFVPTNWGGGGGKLRQPPLFFFPPSSCAAPSPCVQVP